MRFSVLLALFVATFIACASFASAENAAIDNSVRRLKGRQLTTDEEERASANFALLDDATKKLNAEQFVGRAVQNFKIGKINRAADAMKAGVGKAAELTAKQQAQVTKLVTKAAKQKVPWSKTKKIIVGVVGASLTAAAFYAIYKTFLSNGGTATATV